MSRHRYVLPLAMALLPALAAGAGTTAAAAPAPTSPVPCLLVFQTDSTVTCYPPAAVAELPALYPLPITNPVRTVTSMMHLPFRQIVRVDPPGDPWDSHAYASGVYFIFGHYTLRTEQIMNSSPAQPRWLIVIEDGRYPGWDIPFTAVQWSGGGPIGGGGVQTMDYGICQRGRCATAITNQPEPLVRELLTALTVTSPGGWRGVYPE